MQQLLLLDSGILPEGGEVIMNCFVTSPMHFPLHTYLTIHYHNVFQ